MPPAYRTIESLDDIPATVLGSGDFCIVEESSLHPGELTFLHPDQEAFVARHHGFLSRLCMLNDLFMFGRFVDHLAAAGTPVFVLPSARPIIAKFHDWDSGLDVHGLRLPDGLHPYQQFALNRAFDASRFTRSKTSGFFFNFGTGCIQGDAEISVNRGGKGFRIKLRDLVRRFNGDDPRYSWDLSSPTYVQREVDGVVRLGKIRAAWYSGTKQTYTVTTDTGRTIRATDEHPFLTERGWLRLDELRIGDEVHVRGEQNAHEGKVNSVLYKIETERVVSVEPWGLEETYDLEVDDDPHNFIANGFVVHNTGKTVLACAGGQELVLNRGDIDLVLFFTLSSLRVNAARAFEAMTDLSACVPDGAKSTRQRQYADPARVVCLNYEKAHFDHDEIEAMIAGRNVLWIFDEVQKILHADNPKNRARRRIEDLMKATRKSVVWPMSASVVKASPLRYHDCMSLVASKNPLGTRADYVTRYCKEVNRFSPRPGVTVNEYIWDVPALAEVRHRVSAVTQPVRKTDPGVREYFKGVRAFIEPVQLSRDEQRLYDIIAEMGDGAENFGPYYACMRYVCNTPEALIYSESEVAQQVVAEHGDLIAKAKSTKFSMIADKIEEIREQDDQVVVFTEWTFLTLFLFAKELSERGIDYVTHHGGMNKDQRQQAQDTFKSRPECTVFLSSDAGAYGLNFQNARYVINIECPYDPDVLMQRNDRIDRADSHLDGLTSYIYVCDNTVEEEVWRTNELRRQISEATQGTTETLSRFSAEELAVAQMSEHQAMRALASRSLLPR